MITLRYRALVAILVVVALAIVAGFALQSWRVDAASGDSDATFVPITPCRLIDTRPAPNRTGPLAAFGIDDTRSVQAHGSNGDCVIPVDAAGLSLNVTAVGATAPTFLTIWPDGARPNASSVNPFPGEPPTPNAVTTSLSSSGSFEIYNLAGTVNIIVDVNGYYTRASLEDLASRLASAESKLSALEAADAADRLDALETAQPIVVHAEGDQLQSVDAGGLIVRSLGFFTPVDGTLIVDSSHQVAESTEGDVLTCSINLFADIDPEHEQEWQSGGAGDGGIGQMAGTRGFDIPGGGAPYTVYLYCKHSGSSGSSSVYDSSLTAVFYPAP